MPIPVNIDDLINGQIVEWERIEFKKGWNPEAVLHSICAFANDFNNWGGGYIIVGIESDTGQPILPPAGLNQNQLDPIQHELLNICHRLRPNYFPIVEPVVYEEKNILLIWAPGGSNRPYEAPESLGSGSQYHHYIRLFSNTVKANNSERNELLSMAAQIPYDDQINHRAVINDLEQSIIQTYLKKVKSSLTDEFTNKPFKQICQNMNIIEGPDEDIHPKNVGLLFFNSNPETFISGSRIEVVLFEDETGDSFSEKIFDGPLHHQIYDVIEFINSNIIKEKVHKVKGLAEAVRFTNYPLEALDESIVNAVYHKDYRENNPVEIRIFKNRIEILSYPGPLPPLNKDNLNTGEVAARRYRNRRIGDFLKELRLTEGRSTGFPKIRKALKDNGSQPPKFLTDDDRTYFQTTIYTHPLTDVKALLASLTEKHINVLEFCQTPRSRTEILKRLKLSNHTTNYQNQILRLIEKGFLTQTVPGSTTAPNQKYVISNIGKLLLENR
ncbi:MAG: putative DNA binding domain-containing protein [Calditrichaceae bacterium]|nr:putative DNA binding domain-containing protein [Calditrichaceae bacterium]MBN2710236.1 putative DNA binding domain-containing protein [Calditrichaceae bacterium]RQV93860.1 MAG: AAA family ATPase [Calditrichota bacterium]